MGHVSDHELQPAQAVPTAHELSPGRDMAAVKLATGLQVLAFGILSLLVAFASVEGVRLAMLLSGAIGPGDPRWFVMSAIQQVGWQFMLACYGVLLAGTGLLQTSASHPGGRAAAQGGLVCLGLALASRAALIAGVPYIENMEWQTFFLNVAVIAETWCVLGALLALDLFTGRLADELGAAALKTSAMSHLVLVVCLAAAILLPQVVEVDDLRGAVQRMGQLLRLSLGGICLAWAFRIACDARSALRTAGESSTDQ